MPTNSVTKVVYNLKFVKYHTVSSDSHQAVVTWAYMLGDLSADTTLKKKLGKLVTGMIEEFAKTR